MLKLFTGAVGTVSGRGRVLVHARVRRRGTTSMDSASRLLLVEDDEDLRLILEDVLRDAGFEIEIANNGGSALGILESNKNKLGGLITGIDLGSRIDGWKVAKRGRELIPALPVIYMSGASGSEWTSKGVPHSTLVAKPFAPAQLITAISSLLNISDIHS